MELVPVDVKEAGRVGFEALAELGRITAWLTAGFMSRLMFGVSPGNPVLLLTVSAILLGTALVASWIPGRRAARIDALRALSAE
jgi:ABC-type lipoprotein release transport system permease subunit